MEYSKLEQTKYRILKASVDEDDLILDWEMFHVKHPDVTKEEYDLMVKQFQEV